MPRLTEARASAQRQRVLDAALTCFDRLGYRRTTLQDIVRESKLSPGAIYGYFSSKAEIAATVAEERHRIERRLVTSALGSADPLAALLRFVEQYFEWLRLPEERRRRRIAVQTWAESLHDPAMRRSVESGLAPLTEVTRALRAAQRRGRLRPGLDPGSVARMVLAMLQGFVLQQAWNPSLNVRAYRDTVLATLEGLMPRRRVAR